MRIDVWQKGGFVGWYAVTNQCLEEVKHWRITSKSYSGYWMTWTIHILQTSTYNFLANHFWRIPLLKHLFGVTSFHQSIFGVNTPRVSLNLQGLQHSRWPKCGPPQLDFFMGTSYSKIGHVLCSDSRTAHSAQIWAVQGVNFSRIWLDHWIICRNSIVCSPLSSIWKHKIWECWRCVIHGDAFV